MTQDLPLKGTQFSSFLQLQLLLLFEGDQCQHAIPDVFALWVEEQLHPAIADGLGGKKRCQYGLSLKDCCEKPSVPWRAGVSER